MSPTATSKKPLAADPGEPSGPSGTIPRVIDHVSHEVGDLERSARFYDAVFYALGARRMSTGDATVAWGTDTPVFRIARAVNGGPPEGGHVALRAAGKAAVVAAWEAGVGAGGADAGAPAARPADGMRGYAARLRDPDGLRVELVSR
jgi:catechol 2,3-dioxygenase-like lactoylglutathione lyase family enzyme